VTARDVAVARALDAGAMSLDHHVAVEDALPAAVAALRGR
jgi:hypothetical protein